MDRKEKAVQDFYPEDVAHCYGCGRLNREGIQLKTVWEGEDTVSRYTPRPYHTAIPGYVYGGERGGRSETGKLPAMSPRPSRWISSNPLLWVRSSRSGEGSSRSQTGR
jgi:hypothetical protein